VGWEEECFVGWRRSSLDLGSANGCSVELYRRNTTRLKWSAERRVMKLGSTERLCTRLAVVGER
jgi:hypothetical protein